MSLKPVSITIKGEHNTGRTTLGVLFKMFLEENGYTAVAFSDTEPLPAEQKDTFYRRFERNRGRPVIIRVETLLDETDE